MRTHRHRYTGRARELRGNSTDAEQVLWRQLRNRQLTGFKFRRQMPIGTAIADFVCNEAMLIVEVDGGQHGDDRKSDAARTKKLEARGYRVIRFWNHEVLNQTEEVMAEILRQIETPAPHPSPLPTSGERGQEA